MMIAPPTIAQLAGRKANKLVTEANAAIQEARRLVGEGEEKKKAMFATGVTRLAEARAMAREAVTLYDQSEAKCKEAAGKFEAASKLKINDKFRRILNAENEGIQQARGTGNSVKGNSSSFD